MDESPTATALPGFGTAHLMGRIGSRESMRLVQAAFDCGVRHFDTARLYGLGDSEQMLGRALRTRPEAAIFTKVGMGAPRYSAWKSYVYEAARPIARVRARLSGTVVRFRGPAIDIGSGTDFTLSNVKTSVETSLRLSQRDALDGLLLHEVTAAELTPELIGLMEALMSEGKIRQFGVASRPSVLPELAVTGFPGDLLQQAGGPFVEPVGADSHLQVILHSVFGANAKDLQPFQSWLAENAHQRDRLLEVVSAESLRSIPALLMSYTSTRWPCKAIVFASASENHIGETVSAVRHRLGIESLQVISAVLAAYNRDKKALADAG